MNCTPDLLKKQLMAYEHILVTAHVSPDGDAIGSVAAFGELLRHWNKDVHIVIDDDIEENSTSCQRWQRYKTGRRHDR